MDEHTTEIVFVEASLPEGIQVYALTVHMGGGRTLCTLSNAMVIVSTAWSRGTDIVLARDTSNTLVKLNTCSG